MLEFSRLAKSLQDGTLNLLDGAVRLMDSHAIPAASKFDDVVQKVVPAAMNHLANAGDLVSKHARRVSSFTSSASEPLQDQLSTTSALTSLSAPRHVMGYIVCTAEGCLTKISIDRAPYCSLHRSQIKGHTDVTSKLPQPLSSQAASFNSSAIVQMDQPLGCTWNGCNKQRSPEALLCSTHLIEYGAYRQRKCGKKEKHHSLASAERHVKGLELQDWQSRGNFNIYSCEFCGTRHVGHVKKWEWEMR